MKLATAVDDGGDRAAYTGWPTNDPARSLWWLEYRRSSKGNICFILHNKLYDLPLKLGADQDWWGDYTAYGGGSGGDTDRHSWTFEEL
ncbi:hypothetical protein ACFSE0_11255 [Ochrobactrum teleogrylli]|uniref:hypothetical protein n=1 Tax=Ochrobactrum teleogrylli TaxID=2479765 RepID=UPI00353045FF